MSFFRLLLIIGPLPVTLTNGTTADATQVMSDLNWIVNQVNANAASTVNQAVTNSNNNFTTVQSGQAATQPGNFPTALQITNNALQTLSSVLGTNTITARISAVPLGAYVSGQVFTFIPSNANTGAASLNVDGVGARSILNMGSALSGAELQNYRPAIVGYDGNAAAFDLLNGDPHVKGPNIPAAATLNLDGTFGDYNQVDGIATITAMTLSPGRQKLLEFTSSPQITNSGTLVLGSNVLPNPGDVFSFRGEAGLVRMTGAFPSGFRYLSNSLSTNIILSNTANFFDGPQVAQGNGGIWFASGTVNVMGGASSQLYLLKLWDGTNLIASSEQVSGGVGKVSAIALSGICVRPLGNIRISVRDPADTTSKITCNDSTEIKDSTITVVRLP